MTPQIIPSARLLSVLAARGSAAEGVVVVVVLDEAEMSVLADVDNPVGALLLLLLSLLLLLLLLLLASVVEVWVVAVEVGGRLEVLDAD